ncbi:hypothetical protein BH708_02310 [Brachybacterium sp. P6-10-X1]|nr:hypothetical protein BH708_02310 [Brachybacterium sp. P6-10-X1]
MSWARAAAEYARPSRPVRVHALPPTMWIRPARGTGGAKAAADGVLPAAITWHGGTVRLAGTEESPSTEWGVDAAGTTLSGSTRLAPGEGLVGRPEERMWPIHHAPPLSPREAGRILDGLQEAGQLARWQLLSSLESLAHRQIPAVATSIFREVADVDEAQVAPALLDAQQLEVVVTDVIYGTSGADSRILRSLERCLDPATTRKVDPIRYLTAQVRRDLADQVRVAIGDPQVGPRIRRVARALPAGASLESIINRYNQVHPCDRISTTRAIRALTVAPSIESTALRDVFEARHHV